MNYATRTIAAAITAAAASFCYADDMGESLKEAGRDMKEAVKDMRDNVVNKDGDRNAPGVNVPTLPAGFVAKDADDVEDIRSGLVKLVNNTLSRGDYDDGVSYLTNDDRDRIKGQLGNNFAELDAKIEQFHTLFKQKYGEDFKLTREVLDGVTSVQQGEVSDEAVARNNWPVAPMASDRKAADKPATNADPKLTNGRDVAIVHLRGMKDKGGLMISMQHELPDSWVVDVPSTVRGDALYRAHVNCLTKLIEKADNWPDAKDDAYRLIAEKVIHAYYSDDATEMPEMR